MKRMLLLWCLLLGVQVAAGQTTDSVRKEHRTAIRQEMLAFPRSRASIGGRFDATQAKYAYGPYMPDIGVGYSFRVWDFLEVGASLSYSFNNRSHSIAPSLDVRYAWFNSRWVSLYSSVGLCYPFYSGSGCQPGFVGGALYVDVVPVGIRVGRRLFGYFELCRLAFWEQSTPMVNFCLGLGYTF